MRVAGLISVVVLIGAVAAAGEPAFTAKPAASRHGDKVKIAFAVGAPTDVEVAALDSADICLCEWPRLDVDGFGRCFFPDAGRFRVGVIDTSGDEVCRFGFCGNQDSAGPGSAVPAPEIPLCWPHVVAVSDEAACAGDRLSRRVVRVKLGYAAEDACPVP